MTTIYKQVVFRPGAELTHELKARGDNINDVARECVRRYLNIVMDELLLLREERGALSLAEARHLYSAWIAMPPGQWPRDIHAALASAAYAPTCAGLLAVTDALERCSRLLTQGVELDQALREVGLVA